MTWTHGQVCSKIDRIYISEYLNINFFYENISEILISDHKAVHGKMVLKNNNNKSKSKINSQWFLNEQILDLEEVKIGIQKFCREIKTYKIKYENKWYDKFINYVTNFLKIQSRKHSNNKKIIINEIFENLANLNKTRMSYNEDTFIKEKEKLKTKSENYYKEKKEILEKKYREARKSFIKTPTKSLLENKKKNENNLEIKNFLCKNGQESVETDVIIEDINQYYAKLLGEYKCDLNRLKKYEFSIKKLSQDKNKQRYNF